MDDVEREDFISEMYALVFEEGLLYEAPLGAIDRLPSGDVVHGPWDRNDCGQVLGRWHAEGLIGLWVRKPAETDYEVSAADATEVLNSPQRWRPETEEGLASVALTDAGAEVSYERWRELALASPAEG
ncbi:hypothetical protein RB608_24900 [Nocardioides sp. LHD-245]|uniref:hypothetical protein n=1 Tax=Nocardioides sp. LHD-245 TaxID=3051387 RepID=UPI0027DFB4D6|nr:hypothetical protein [Nocardioides sp. LHD-245]